jgi:hypothetical protein
MDSSTEKSERSAPTNEVVAALDVFRSALEDDDNSVEDAVRIALRSLLDGFTRVYVVIQAAGYPDPYRPWPNTLENAQRFAREHRRDGYPSLVRTRLASQWETLDD